MKFKPGDLLASPPQVVARPFSCPRRAWRSDRCHLASPAAPGRPSLSPCAQARLDRRFEANLPDDGTGIQMQEISPAERNVQILAGIAGLAVAGVVAIFVGFSAGFSAGLAVFFLSWTFVAILVLLVRFVFRRLSPVPEAALTPAKPARPHRPKRSRRRH